MLSIFNNHGSTAEHLKQVSRYKALRLTLSHSDDTLEPNSHR